MRKWLPTTLCALVGLALGFAIGYVTFLSRTIFNNPAFVNIPARGDDFNRIFEGMARLSSDETLLSTKSEASKLALSNEDQILQRLQFNVEQTKFSPPLKVAAARLLVRRTSETPRRDPETEARIQELLEASGWENPLPDHMRDLIQGIDKDSCNCKRPDAKGLPRR